MTNSGLDATGIRPGLGGQAARLPWLLRRTNQRYRAAIRERLAARGFAELPQPGYWALMILAQGGTDARQLIREMGISKQAVSKLVDALVSGGFVERKPNDADRRRMDLLLSSRGHHAAEVVADAVRETEEAVTRELGVDRFAELVQMLEQLTWPRD
ncbi:MAG: MarR family transcriptional regulator [Acidimicrobiales bacterium]|jgi:DNA-binding MarR family transcriptional regulator